jgi:Ser/Thr protein kinase RdoA (MazF antagonist)
VTPAAVAAVRVARRAGLQPQDPLVLEETNNTVMWLRPEEVVAKVATRPNAVDGLWTEWRIASELVLLRAEVAAPLPGSGPTIDEPTGLVVTLWERVVGEPHVDLAPATVGRSLQRLHAALARTQTPVPSFRSHLVLARTALGDPAFPGALPPVERAFLRQAFDVGLARLGTLSLAEHRLHGEPHYGNRLWTGTGITWLDFEGCCTGPVEWDLAAYPRASRLRFRPSTATCSGSSAP